MLSVKIVLQQYRDNIRILVLLEKIAILTYYDILNNLFPPFLCNIIKIYAIRSTTNHFIPTNVYIEYTPK